MIRYFLTIFAVLSLIPGLASGQADEAAGESEQAETLLRKAESQYDQMDYEEALKTLIQVQMVKGVSATQRATAYLYMGICFTAVGKAEDAVQAFASLLKLKPEFRLPENVSPSIQSMFKEAMGRLKLPQSAPGDGRPPGSDGVAGEPSAGPGEDEDLAAMGEADGSDGSQSVGLHVKAPQNGLSGRPITLDVTLTDRGRLATQILVYWRRVGGPDFSIIKETVKPGRPGYAITIPAIELPPDKPDERGQVLFFVEVAGAEDSLLAHHGTLEAPIKLAVVPAPESPSNAKWWILGVGAGLVVVGGIVAAAVLLRPESDGTLPSEVGATVILK